TPLDRRPANDGALDKPKRHLPIVAASAAAPAPTKPIVAKPKSSFFSKYLKRKKKKLPGSGIPARPVIRVLLWARRVAQVTFLGIFLWFLFQTAFRGTFAAGA